MTGIVDVGGGMRGIFSAGIYDRFIEEGINFDLCIGVSAGSANLISYAAGHHDRVKRFYVNYAQRKQYMSFDNFIHSGSYIGLDYIYSTISNSDGEDPLNYDAFTANHTDFITVVTDGETGEPIYFPDGHKSLLLPACGVQADSYRRQRLLRRRDLRPYPLSEGV